MSGKQLGTWAFELLVYGLTIMISRLKDVSQHFCSVTNILTSSFWFSITQRTDWTQNVSSWRAYRMSSWYHISQKGIKIPIPSFVCETTKYFTPVPVRVFVRSNDRTQNAQSTPSYFTDLTCSSAWYDETLVTIPFFITLCRLVYSSFFTVHGVHCTFISSPLSLSSMPCTVHPVLRFFYFPTVSFFYSYLFYCHCYCCLTDLVCDSVKSSLP